MAPGYDANGNLSGLSEASYVYDAQNRVVSATASGTTMTFAYDARNSLREAHHERLRELPLL